MNRKRPIPLKKIRQAYMLVLLVIFTLFLVVVFLTWNDQSWLYTVISGGIMCLSLVAIDQLVRLVERSNKNLQPEDRIIPWIPGWLVKIMKLLSDEGW